MQVRLLLAAGPALQRCVHATALTGLANPIFTQLAVPMPLFRAHVHTATMKNACAANLHPAQRSSHLVSTSHSCHLLSRRFRLSFLDVTVWERNRFPNPSPKHNPDRPLL